MQIWGDCKVRAIKIGNEWFVTLRDIGIALGLHHIGIALGVRSDTLKATIRHNLPQQYKFSRRTLVLIALMIDPYCSLQCLEPAESY